MKTRQKELKLSQEHSQHDELVDNDLAAKYILNCQRFELQVDSSVLISLKTEWSLLQPTKNFSEGAMLPLMGILDTSKTITKVNLANVAMNDSR